MIRTTLPPSPTRGGALKGFVIALALLLVLSLGIGGCAVGKYNGLVAQEPAIEAAWTVADSPSSVTSPSRSSLRRSAQT